MTGWRALALSGLAGLAAAALVAVPASLSRAGVTSSAHDFTGFGFVDEGACSACHKPHYSVDPQRLWPRDLTDERSEFDQGDSAIETPNYIRGGTILCYDCHDNQNTADVDEDPDPIFWGNSVHGGPDGYPQDIAYDDHPGVQGSGTVGYYELIDGSRPSGVSGGGPTDGSPTGGHFWQSAPDNGGSPEYEQGDKLDCSICHDPHSRVTGTNDVMFRTSTSDGTGGTIDLGDGRTASVNTRARAGSDPQVNNGRDMCASCHRYSDEPNAPGATANGIPTTTVEMWNVPLPQPPDILPDHAYDANSTVACTICHKHNKIVAACDDCHGYPPTSANQSYPGGGGAHEAHFEGVGRSGLPAIYDFGCLGGACHPADQHPQGNAGDYTDVQRANVQVVFNPAWNPDALPYDTAGQTCSQLYCHGNGLTENGELGTDNGTGEGGTSGLGEYAETAGGGKFYGTSPAVQPSWTDTFSGLGIDQCRACHGKGALDYRLEVNGASPPGVVAQVSPPDYYNAGTQAVQDGSTIYNTTGANTHFIHVYKINSEDPAYGMWAGGVELNPGADDTLNTGCGCHPIRVQRDPGTGFSYHLDRRASLGDASAVDNLGVPNSVGRGCANECHNGATPADWGDNLAAAGGANDSCVFVCHGLGNTASSNYYGGSPGGRITKLDGVGGAQDSADKYMQSGHGLPSGSYASGSPAANLACSDCHLLDDRGGVPATRSYHYERVATATGNPNAPLAPGQPGANPYWLLGPYAADPDGLCETCHDPLVLTDPHNHTAQVMIDTLGYQVKYDTGTPGTWDSFTPNCVNCHDPHGESNWFMLYDGDPEKSADQNSLVVSGPNIFDGSRFGVTIDQADTHGFPPGDYIPPIVTPISANQTGVAMTDNTNGSDYAVGNGSGICEVCHTLTNFYNNTGTGSTHLSSLCSDCHKHPEGFAPSGCEGCHGCPTNPGLDGIAGNADDAPNVMGNGTDTTGTGGTPKLCDDGSYGYNVNGHGANGTAGATPSGFNPNSDCPDCHDISDPPGQHFNGIVESVFVDATRNANTAHLNAGFIDGAPGNEWDVQVTFDSQCWTQCHQGSGVADMRHARDGIPAAAPMSVQFGTHLTRSDGDAIQPPGFPGPYPAPTLGPWPIDTDISTNTTAAQPHFAPCVSCHDPHGTNVDEPSRARNRMMRDQWITNSGVFCNTCHGGP